MSYQNDNCEHSETISYFQWSVAWVKPQIFNTLVGHNLYLPFSVSAVTALLLFTFLFFYDYEMLTLRWVDNSYFNFEFLQVTSVGLSQLCSRCIILIPSRSVKPNQWGELSATVADNSHPIFGLAWSQATSHLQIKQSQTMFVFNLFLS